MKGNRYFIKIFFIDKRTLNTLKFNLISFLKGLKVKNFPTFLFSFKSNLKARKSIWNGN